MYRTFGRFRRQSSIRCEKFWVGWSSYEVHGSVRPDDIIAGNCRKNMDLELDLDSNPIFHYKQTREISSVYYSTSSSIE